MWRAGYVLYRDLVLIVISHLKHCTAEHSYVARRACALQRSSFDCNITFEALYCRTSAKDRAHTLLSECIKYILCVFDFLVCIDCCFSDN